MRTPGVHGPGQDQLPGTAACASAKHPSGGSQARAWSGWLGYIRCRCSWAMRTPNTQLSALGRADPGSPTRRWPRQWAPSPPNAATATHEQVQRVESLVQRIRPSRRHAPPPTPRSRPLPAPGPPSLTLAGSRHLPCPGRARQRQHRTGPRERPAGCPAARRRYSPDRRRFLVGLRLLRSRRPTSLTPCPGHRPHRRRPHLHRSHRRHGRSRRRPRHDPRLLRHGRTPRQATTDAAPWSPTSATTSHRCAGPGSAPTTSAMARRCFPPLRQPRAFTCWAGKATEGQQGRPRPALLTSSSTPWPANPAAARGGRRIRDAHDGRARPQNSTAPNTALGFLAETGA